MSSSSSDALPLRVALLGAGIFASEAHAPVLQKNPSVFSTEAVWSRRPEPSARLAATLNTKSYSGDDGLEEVLQRADIEAVIIALPLDVQPEYVRKALQHGKHVLSEKPIAPTVQEAQQLLKDYRALCDDGKKLKWSVAENYRYEPAVVSAAEAVKTSVGIPQLITLTVRAPFTLDNKYLKKSSWRSSGSWYGGFFIDSFVHASAMLRYVLGEEAQSVSAVTSSRAEHLPSVDTMTGHVTWEKSGAQGTIAVTYAGGTMKYELEVVGTEGTVLLQRRTDGPGYRLVVNGKEEVFGFGGIAGEFMGFAKACRDEEIDRNSPEEALGDVTFVEALLLSGKEDGATKRVLDVKRQGAMT